MTVIRIDQYRKNKNKQLTLQELRNLEGYFSKSIAYLARYRRYSQVKSVASKMLEALATTKMMQMKYEKDSKN